MLSEKPWKLELLIQLALSIMLCVFGTALAFAAIEKMGGWDFSESPWRLVAAALSFQGMTLVFVHFFLRAHFTTWREAFGLNHRSARAVLIGLVTILVALPALWGLQWLIAGLMEQFNMEPTEQQAVEALRLAQGVPQLLPLGIVTIVLAPVGEEILFRGIFYTAVKNLGFPRLALWGTSAFFAVIHWNLPTFIPLLALALLLAMLYEKTGNLLSSIVAHSLFNTLNFVLLLLSEFSNGGPH